MITRRVRPASTDGERLSGCDFHTGRSVPPRRRRCHCPTSVQIVHVMHANCIPSCSDARGHRTGHSERKYSSKWAHFHRWFTAKRCWRPEDQFFIQLWPHSYRSSPLLHSCMLEWREDACGSIASGWDVLCIFDEALPKYVLTCANLILD